MRRRNSTSQLTASSRNSPPSNYPSELGATSNAFSRPIRQRRKEMKNLFERETVDEVISRIDTLRPTTPRQWGKMDVAQMLAHCSAAMDMASDRLKLPRRFIGRLLGPFVKPIFTNEKP